MKTENTEDSSTSPWVRSISLPTDDDHIADKELQAVDEESYGREARKKEHKRTEKFKDAKHTGALIVFGIATLVLIVVVLVWAWHLLTPTPWRWLTSGQIDEIHRMMSSAILAVFFREYARKFFA
ncbi:MAG: hypothetical protein OXU71_02160 [Gammaproteobacteria bacterium]|nr:hypothetical protein [Gammaproteobacteria bacterium]